MDLRRALRSLASEGPPPSPGTLARALAAAPDPEPEPDAPADLVARPASLPAHAWHAQALLAAIERPASAVRRAWHARWLLHLHFPDDPEARLRVSTVIPVWNRAWAVGDAVASALAQTHPHVEVLVVDDGSDDDVAGALAPWRDRITLLSQRHRGVSAARNAALAVATGELVHFLDSDNLLDPDAYARGISAFRQVPDADVCFSTARPGALPGAEGLIRANEPTYTPTGLPECPTTDFLGAVAASHPFLMLGTLISRWRVLEAGSFDESYPAGEDTVFWGAVALRDAKAIGLREPQGTRRWASNSRSRIGAQGPRAWIRSDLETLLGLLEEPRHWRHVGIRLQRMLALPPWGWTEPSDDPHVLTGREQLLRVLEGLGDGRRREGLSPGPLLGLFRHAARQARARDLPGSGGEFHARFVSAVERGLSRAPTPDARDHDYWIRAGSRYGLNDAALADVLGEAGA